MRKSTEAPRFYEPKCGRVRGQDGLCVCARTWCESSRAHNCAAPRCDSWPLYCQRQTERGPCESFTQGADCDSAIFCRMAFRRSPTCGIFAAFFFTAACVQPPPSRASNVALPSVIASSAPILPAPSTEAKTPEPKLAVREDASAARHRPYLPSVAALQPDELVAFRQASKRASKCFARVASQGGAKQLCLRLHVAKNGIVHKVDFQTQGPLVDACIRAQLVSLQLPKSEDGVTVSFGCGPI